MAHQSRLWYCVSCSRPVAPMVEQRSPKPRVGGSSPSWPANLLRVQRRRAGSLLCAGVAQWQSSSLPSWSRGFDSHHPLHCHGSGVGAVAQLVEHQLCTLGVRGSNPLRSTTRFVGESPSGKAPAFGAGIRRFESCLPSQFFLPASPRAEIVPASSHNTIGDGSSGAFGADTNLGAKRVCGCAIQTAKPGCSA